MPNHVSQDLRVSGDKKSLEEFFVYVQKNDSIENDSLLNANKVIPYPQEFSLKDKLGKIAREQGDYFFKDGFNSGGYEWCIENWGSKWGIYDAIIVKNNLLNSGYKRFLLFKFNTAWSAPLPLIVKMGEMFPSLTFKLKYYERGMGFAGVFVVKGKEILEDFCRNDYKGNREG